MQNTTSKRRASGRTKPQADAKPKPATATFLLRPPEPLPAEIPIAPQSGVVAEPIDFSYPVLTPLPLAEAGPVRKKKLSAKKPAKPRKRKPAPRKAKAVPLPQTPVPKAELAVQLPPAAPSPLPRGRALAPYRDGGLFGLIGSWLGERTRRMAALLSRKRAPAVRAAKVRSRSEPDELTRLRQENERLRLQVEALLALRQGDSAA